MHLGETTEITAGDQKGEVSVVTTVWGAVSPGRRGFGGHHGVGSSVTRKERFWWSPRCGEQCHKVLWTLVATVNLQCAVFCLLMETHIIIRG